MAALAKLTILVGAGVAGTLLAREESLFSVKDLFSGAFKIFSKHLQQDKSGSSSDKKPQNEFLLAQVNNLRKQLQSLQSTGSVTIVTGTGSGQQVKSSFLPCSFLPLILFGAGPSAASWTAIIVVGAFGYGYIWWKGWRLSEMMFVTRRSLSDACSTVAKQLDTISSSISSTKRHLSSRIDRVDCSLNDCIEISSATMNEVSELHGELNQIHVNVENVHIKVRTLESKLGRIEGSQDMTTRGIRHLCEFVMNLERGRSLERIRTSQSPVLSLEGPQPLQLPSTGSPSTATSAPESTPLSSPLPVETPKVLRTITVSASGLKELQEASSSLRPAHLLRAVPARDIAAETRADTVASSGVFGWKLPGLLSRTRSAN
ncbi:uncharacterized protein LOC144704151 isoform X1 [Wolffia australiana]